MTLRFTLLIEKTTESNNLIGSIHEIPGSIHKTDHLPEFNEWARASISSYLSSLGQTNEQYELRYYYDHSFIVNSRKDDPEPMFAKSFLDMFAGQANMSFDSANQFAKTFLNSLILLNGGAVIAILTFFGNFTEKTLKINNLEYGIYGFVVGLFFAAIACGIGFLCQNTQTKECGCTFAEIASSYCTSFKFERLPIAVKNDLSKLRSNIWVTATYIRWTSSIFAVISLCGFGFGSYYSLLSICENIL